ncbi:hypothetical protein ILYODFUR_023114, partial [Ilyodon furcidens]
IASRLDFQMSGNNKKSFLCELILENSLCTPSINHQERPIMRGSAAVKRASRHPGESLKHQDSS